MTKKIFIIAGEPSGDALGASLMQSIRARAGDEKVEFSGVGGDLMAAQGLESLLPMDELCVMGLWEVLSHLPRLLGLINGVVEEVEKYDPNVVITIDLPDFNFQLGQRLKKRGQSRAKLIHYVAPSVWAWREKRAPKIAAFLDGLMCLLPFEPPYFEKYKLPTRFVGHPLVEKNLESVDGAAFRQKHDIDQDALVLGVLFGSRASEVKKHGDDFRETIQALFKHYPDMVLVVPTLPALEFEVREALAGIKSDAIIITDPNLKYQAFAASDVALAVSGTVGLELAYMNVPHVIGYKVHPATYVLARLLVKTKYAHLANILLEDDIVPECLQGKCSPLYLSQSLLKLLKSEKARADQKEAFAVLRDYMRGNRDTLPSDKAASFVFDILNGTYKPDGTEIKKPDWQKRVPAAPAADPKPEGVEEEPQEQQVEGISLPALIEQFKSRFLKK